MANRVIFVFILIAVSLSGCISAPVETGSIPTETVKDPTPILPTNSLSPTPSMPQSSLSPNLEDYKFPDSIDPEKRYLFYLHGRIIEEQGLPAISPEYGEYEYEAILEKLSGYGFVVISEQRQKNPVVDTVVQKIAVQVEKLVEAGVPEANITVVGASKGALIAALVSYFLQKEEVNYVIMAICNPEILEDFNRNQIFLSGNVLSIYDSVDEFGGSCQELFSRSEGRGLTSYDEIVLNIGTGHGILYQPLDDWVSPVVEWANRHREK